MKKRYPFGLLFLLLFAGMHSVLGNVFYVNDNSTSNDIYTSAVGNDGNNGSAAAPFATITYAISQAFSGDTIYVDVGSYHERFTINKSLVLLGAKAGLDARTRSVASGESILDGTGFTGTPYDAIKIANNIFGVVIDGFEIRNYGGGASANGDGNAISSYCMSTNKVGANDVRILNNYIHDVAYNGVLVGSENTDALNTSMVIQYGWLIQYNKISNYKYAGVELTNVINSAVKDNAISAPMVRFNDYMDAGVGIEVAARSRAKPALVDSVEVSGNTISGSFPDSSRTAINLLARAYQAASNAGLTAINVERNTISSAIKVYSAIYAVAETRNGTAFARLSDIDILDNTFDGNSIALAIRDYKNSTGTPSHDSITVSGNFIKNQTNKGLYVASATSAKGVKVLNNNFENNNDSNIVNAGTDTLSATCNWFGSSYYTQIPYTLHGNIYFIPYLTNGNETDPSPGFQPPGSCDGYPVHVNGAGYATIQEGIDNGTGKRVYISSGTYTENPDATGSGKDVTLLPGNSPGCDTVNGNFSINSGDTLLMDIDGTTPCSGFDRWTINGTVSLGGASLALNLNYAPVKGDTFLIVSNDGSDAISGQFAEGSDVSATYNSVTYHFKISYTGGDGNDIVLTLATVHNLTQGLHYTSIQPAVTAANAGDQILIDAGMYRENVSINKYLQIAGAGNGSDSLTNTIIYSKNSGTATVLYTVGGNDSANRQVLRRVRITGASGGTGNNNSGVLITGSSSFGHFSFDSIVATGNAGHGWVSNFGSPSNRLHDVVINHSTFSSNGNCGIKTASHDVDSFAVYNSYFLNNASQGLGMNTSDNGTAVISNVTLQDVDFSGNNAVADFYAFRLLGKFTATNVDFLGSGGSGLFGLYVLGSYLSETAAPIAPSMVLNNVNFSGTYTSAGLSFLGYSQLDSISLNNVVLNTTIATADRGQIRLSGVGGNLNLGNTAVNGTSPLAIRLNNNFNVAGSKAIVNVDATNATFNGLKGSDMTLTQLYDLETKIRHGVDSFSDAPGIVRVKANNLYITPPYGFIQRGIDSSANGDTVNIQGGAYLGNMDAATGVNSSKDLFFNLGASPACDTLTGNMVLNTGDTVIMDVDGTTPCSGHDQYLVNGTVTLGGASLNLLLGYTPSSSDVITLIDNDGTSDAVTGTFAQGNSITVGGYTFTIQYDGGDGNDVVLYLGPTVTCPSDTTVGNDYGNCSAVVNGISPVTTGSGTSVTYVITGSTNASGSSDASGVTFSKDTSYVKYIITDAGGNKDSCTFRVVVLDTSAPAFTRPADTTIYKSSSCVADTSLAQMGDVTDETDNCNSGLEATYRDSVVAGSCQGTFIVKRIWSLVDSSGNAASDQIQTINVLDTIRPTFTAPADTTLYKNASCLADTSLATTGDVTNELDNCSTGLQASHRDSAVAGSCQGSYTIKRIWSLVDSCGNAAADQIQTITVLDTTRPVITSCPANTTRKTTAGKTYYQVPNRAFDATASDNCSQSDSITYRFILSGAIDSTGSGTLLNVKLPFGTTTVKWLATDACGNTSDTCVFTVKVDTVVSFIGVGDVNVGPSSSQQYSDSVTLSASVAPWPSNPGDPSLIPSGKIVFYLGTERMGEAIVSDTSNPADEIGEASITVPLLELQSILDYTRYNAGQPTNGPLKPGPKFLTAVFVSFNPVYEGDTTTSTDTLHVTKENAIVRVDNSDGYFSVNPTTYKGMVWFRANVSDTNDVPLGGRGDIRNATIQFLDGSSYPSSPINGTRNVGLIDPNDKTQGQALLSFEYQLNNTEIASGGKSWLVWAQANNYYTGYDNSDMNIVTLGMPGSEFVTGGGHYIMELSGGTYAGETGKKMNFGFNMKWNKSGKNLQGKINIIYRRVVNGQLRIFHIKSNAIGTLAVSSTSFLDVDGVTRLYSTALMTSQASLTDITDPNNPIGYGGNNNLKVVAWDSRQTGSAGEWDKIAVELFDGKTSQLLFSSYIAGGSTRVRTINGGNVNIRNTNPIVPPACTQPSNLYVDNLSNTGATLHWLATSGLRDSVEYRIQGSASAWTPASVSTGTNLLAISSLQPGTIYEWRVMTICTDTTRSTWSNGQFTTTINCTDAPTGLMTSAITSSSATLKWASVGTASAYFVEYRLLGSASWDNVTVSTNYYNLLGLNEDTTYEWRVTNVCTEGTPASSSVQQFVTPSGCVTGNLLASNITVSSARLHWDAAPSATGYNLRWKESASSTWNDVTLGAVNYYDLTTLNASTEYGFQVQVICTEGNADWADTAVFTTLAACGTPTGLQTSSITNAGATLKWTGVPGAINYTLRYRIHNDASWTQVSSIATNSYVLSALNQDTTYEWGVAANCTAGTGNWSATVLFKTLKTVTCSAPTGLTATTYANKTTALLSWTGPIGANYTLQYKKSTSAAWTSVNTATTSQALTLSKNTTYKWQVTAYCSGVLGGTTTGPDFTTGVASVVTSGAAQSPEVTMLENSLMQLQVKAYPNPTTGDITLSMTGFDEGQVVIRVIDIFGKTVMNTGHYLIRGRGTMPMQLGNVTNGVYLIQVSQKDKVKTLKLLKN